jgi:hypothetical protein
MPQQSRRSMIVIGLTVFFLVSLACALPTGQPQTPGLEQTSIALAVEQTSVSQDKATHQAQDAPTTAQPPTQTLPAPTTTTAPPAASPDPTAAPHTATLDLPTPTATLEPSPVPIDIEAQIKSANVLVFEDMAGYYERKPLVRQAVSEMNFSGGKVISVNDALGKFKEQLLNSMQWDLIVIAAEHRSAVQGEFWQYVYDQMNRGAALAIEVWYLDEHYTDIQPIFRQCGIEYQKDWLRGPKYNMLDYAIFWLQPDHPFFQPPQEPVSLANPNYLYWVPPLTQDGGDLIQIGSGGDAVLLAGTQANQKSQYGVLASCMQGTVIVQTYSTHDYKEGEVIALWKNYMRYTLTNHFLQQNP